MLIRDGAILVRGADDVMEALAAGRVETPPETVKPQAKAGTFSERTADLHRQILDRLGPSPVPEDQLIRDLEREAAIVSPEITALEVEGKIRRQPGGLLARAE